MPVTWAWIMLNVSASVLAAVYGTHVTSLTSPRSSEMPYGQGGGFKQVLCNTICLTINRSTLPSLSALTVFHLCRSTFLGTQLSTYLNKNINKKTSTSIKKNIKKNNNLISSDDRLFQNLKNMLRSRWFDRTF